MRQKIFDPHAGDVVRLSLQRFCIDNFGGICFVGLVTFQIIFHNVQLPKNAINVSVLMFHDTLDWQRAQGNGTIE